MLDRVGVLAAWSTPAAREYIDAAMAKAPKIDPADQAGPWSGKSEMPVGGSPDSAPGDRDGGAIEDRC